MRRPFYAAQEHPACGKPNTSASNFTRSKGVCNAGPAVFTRAGDWNEPADPNCRRPGINQGAPPIILTTKDQFDGALRLCQRTFHLPRAIEFNVNQQAWREPAETWCRTPSKALKAHSEQITGCGNRRHPGRAGSPDQPLRSCYGWRQGEWEVRLNIGAGNENLRHYRYVEGYECVG